MTTTITPKDLERTFDDLVRRVPGVKTLYRSTPPVAALAAAVIPSLADEPFVLVHKKKGILTVTFTIAAESSALVTCCAVHDTIADYLLTLGYHDSVVKVTVGQVLE